MRLILHLPLSDGIRQPSVNRPTIPFRRSPKMPTRRPLPHRGCEILGRLSKVDPEILA
jgi:hypothetical protein